MLQRTNSRKTRGGKAPPAATREPKRNMSAAARRRTLLDAAVELFAEKGMGITMQELADKVGVTQPLIHRYFATKADLIAAICDRIQNAHWDPEWKVVVTDRKRPIEDRIEAFYRSYLPHIYCDTWYRGFWYAALTDPTFADSYLGHVTMELLVSMVGEVRHHYGYPTLKAVPVTEREIELVWGMHSSLVFVGIRRYVYHSPVSDDIDMIVRDQMHAFLLLAPHVFEELMPGRARKRKPAKQKTGRRKAPTG